MQSVQVLVTQVDEKEVREFLFEECRAQEGPPWIVGSRENPALYIHVGQHNAGDFETDEWSEIVAALGAQPSLQISIDISGRDLGSRDLFTFLAKVLDKSKGVAPDDYTNHPWSMLEIKKGHKVKGHPFFDIEGWHRELRGA